MQPSKEYLDQIAKRLEALNPHITPESIKQAKTGNDFDVLGWIGQSGMDYLQNKKDQNVGPDPLFPDRNSY
jgi:hypothetical protein